VCVCVCVCVQVCVCVCVHRVLSHGLQRGALDHCSLTGPVPPARRVSLPGSRNRIRARSASGDPERVHASQSSDRVLT